MSALLLNCNFEWLYLLVKIKNQPHYEYFWELRYITHYLSHLLSFTFVTHLPKSSFGGHVYLWAFFEKLTSDQCLQHLQIPFQNSNHTLMTLSYKALLLLTCWCHIRYYYYIYTSTLCLPCTVKVGRQWFYHIR